MRGPFRDIIEELEEKLAAEEKEKRAAWEANNRLGDDLRKAEAERDAALSKITDMREALEKTKDAVMGLWSTLKDEGRRLIKQGNRMVVLAGLECFHDAYDLASCALNDLLAKDKREELDRVQRNGASAD